MIASPPPPPVAPRTRYALDAVLWTATHLDDFVWAVISGLWAAFVTHPDREVYPILASLVGVSKSGWRSRLAPRYRAPVPPRVKHLPRNGRYVVMSDHHLLYTQAPHDYFGSPTTVPRFQNERIYAALATHYGGLGWTLIENGDVEDLLVPEPAFDRSDCLRSAALSRLHLGFDRKLRREIRLRQLIRIRETYRGYYAHLLQSFGVDRIVKLVGNHDTELMQQDFAAQVPLAVPIWEFALVAPGDRGEPAVVVCHGHQMDPWTCRKTADEVGESITESFAWAGQGADRIWDRTDWGPPLRASNALVSFGFGRGRGWVPKLHHMSETRVMAELASLDLGDRRPWLILGHTHEPRFRKVERYVNAAAAGRYQDLVWAAEVENGQPKLIAWWLQGDDLVRGELVESGDLLECPVTRVVGQVGALPYPARPASLEAIRAAVESVVPTTAKPWGWLVVRVLLNVPLPLGLLTLIALAVRAVWRAITGA